MNMRDIIIAKRDKNSLTDEQIKFFVEGVTDGSIPDYQISALLMAIVLNGMDEREMTTLTLEMAASGSQMDLSYLEGVPVDKHSTGGVGDKITPVLLPLIATFGVETVKLSGRGLGFTFPQTRKRDRNGHIRPDTGPCSRRQDPLCIKRCYGYRRFDPAYCIVHHEQKDSRRRQGHCP